MTRVDNIMFQRMGLLRDEFTKIHPTSVVGQIIDIEVWTPLWIMDVNIRNIVGNELIHEMGNV